MFWRHHLEVTLQILYLTHVCFNRDSDIIGSDDLLALAAVYMYMKLHVSLQQRYPHSLSESLTAFTALLVRLQHDDVPVLHNASHRPASRTRRTQDAATAEL